MSASSNGFIKNLVNLLNQFLTILKNFLDEELSNCYLALSLLSYTIPLIPPQLKEIVTYFIQTYSLIVNLCLGADLDDYLSKLVYHRIFGRIDAFANENTNDSVIGEWFRNFIIFVIWIVLTYYSEK